MVSKEQPIPSNPPLSKESTASVPKSISNQELLIQQIEEGIQASDEVYTTTQGKNFLGS